MRRLADRSSAGLDERERTIARSSTSRPVSRAARAIPRERPRSRSQPLTLARLSGVRRATLEYHVRPSIRPLLAPPCARASDCVGFFASRPCRRRRRRPSPFSSPSSCSSASVSHSRQSTMGFSEHNAPCIIVSPALPHLHPTLFACRDLGALF